MKRNSAKVTPKIPRRNGQLAMIHIAAQWLGMDPSDPSTDSTYRSMLWSIARVRSAKDLDVAGREAVLKHLKALGWQDPREQTGRPVYKRGSQAALIRHLWTRLSEAGEVQDSSDKALRAYVKAQSAPYHRDRVGWDDPRLMPSFAAGRVIEHLKQWCERAGVAR